MDAFWSIWFAALFCLLVSMLLQINFLLSLGLIDLFSGWLLYVPHRRFVRSLCWRLFAAGFVIENYFLDFWYRRLLQVTVVLFFVCLTSAHPSSATMAFADFLGWQGFRRLLSSMFDSLCSDCLLAGIRSTGFLMSRIMFHRLLPDITRSLVGWTFLGLFRLVCRFCLLGSVLLSWAVQLGPTLCSNLLICSAQFYGILLLHWGPRFILLNLFRSFAL